MGKVKTARRAGAAGSSPYDRHSKRRANDGPKAGVSAAPKTNIFNFNKNVGQHILKNPGVADAIVAKAQLRPTDVVLEIGPGTGNITVRMLDKVRSVISIELDPRMAAEITKRVQGSPEQKKLQVMLGDAIKADFPPFDVCVSNTPYQISSPLVFKLLAIPNWRTAILMFQKEFAQRLTAQVGDPFYSRLSVNAQFYAKITPVLKVGKSNFKPMPQVESTVVKIEPKQGKERPTVNFREWDSVLRICFNRKNKTLRACWLLKDVLDTIGRNYITWLSMNNMNLEEAIADHNKEAEGKEVDRFEDLQDVNDVEYDMPDFFDDQEVEWNGFETEDGEDVEDEMPDFVEENGKETQAKPSAENSDWSRAVETFHETCKRAAFDEARERLEMERRAKEQKAFQESLKGQFIHPWETMDMFLERIGQGEPAKRGKELATTKQVKSSAGNGGKVEWWHPIDMELDGAGRIPNSKRTKKTRALVEKKVLKVLTRTGLGEKRARHCSERDFLRLLSGLNEEGIHFS